MASNDASDSDSALADNFDLSSFTGVSFDGSTLEGGGQLLRNAIALSAIQQIPVFADNVRKNRTRGSGLKAQHVAGIRLVTQICDAQTSGVSRGSSSILFHPRRNPVVGDYVADAVTAGSTALLAQVAVPVLLFADVESVIGRDGEIEGSGGGTLDVELNDIKTEEVEGTPQEQWDAESIEEDIAIQIDTANPTELASNVPSFIHPDDPADGAEGSSGGWRTESCTEPSGIKSTEHESQDDEWNSTSEVSSDKSADNASEEEADDGSRMSTLTLHGGTNAAQAPFADFIQQVLFPTINFHFLQPDSYICSQTSGGNLGTALEILRRGFFPKGGGTVKCCVPTLSKGDYLSPIDFRSTSFGPDNTSRIASEDPSAECGRANSGAGTRLKIEGKVYVYGSLPERIAYELRDGALDALNSTMAMSFLSAQIEADIKIDVEYAHADNTGSDTSLPVRASGSGSGIFLLAALEKTGCKSPLLYGASGNGQKGTPARNTGSGAARELMQQLGLIASEGSAIGQGLGSADVDEWTQDQIIIFMALANGWSCVRTGGKGLTLHTRTAMWVAASLTGALFEVEEEEEDGGTVLKCFSVGVDGRCEPSRLREDNHRISVNGEGENAIPRRNIAPFIHL